MGFKSNHNKNGGGENREARTPAVAKTPEAAPAEAAMSSNDLAKVQDLLFGSRIREQRDEIARLEAHIAQQSSHVGEHIAKSVGALESALAGATRELQERCNAESGERKVAGEAFTKCLREFEHCVDAKFAALEERSSRAERELRDQLASQCKLLRDAMAQSHEAAMKFAKEGLEELKATKIDRSALSAVLLELAMRLDSETVAPPAAAPSLSKS